MSCPKTEAVIERVMARFPGSSISASARYYEAVHQELAPLTRELETQVGDMALLIKQLARSLRKASPGDEIAVRALDYLKRHDLLGSLLR